MRTSFLWLPCLLLASCCGPSKLLSQADAGEQNVVVILDDSGSMNDRMQTANGKVKRIDVAKEALIGILSELPPNTSVGVLALNSQVGNSNWVVPLESDSSQTDWRERIGRIEAGGATPLGQFLKSGADALLEARQAQVYGDFRLLVVTDGEANDSRLLEKILPDVLSRGLMVDVIGVDMKSQHSLATKVHSYRRADDDQSLKQALTEVFAETAAGGQDAEADFEILSALPDGFAEAALKALNTKGNQPIQAISGSGPSGPSGSVNSGGQVSVSSGILGFLCCMGPPLVVFVVIVTVVTAFAKRRGR